MIIVTLFIICKLLYFTFLGISLIFPSRWSTPSTVTPSHGPILVEVSLILLLILNILHSIPLSRPRWWRSPSSSSSSPPPPPSPSPPASPPRPCSEDNWQFQFQNVRSSVQQKRLDKNKTTTSVKMLPLKLFFVSSSSFEVLSQDIQLGLMTKHWKQNNKKEI